MDSCDVLIVGAGPAGSACAWKLMRAGLDVAMLEKGRFPRDKVCGGWITPPVLEELEIDPRDYAGSGRIFQPITGFRTSRMGDAEVETHYGKPVSYGIRRFEFDHYLAARSRARLIEGAAFSSLERLADGWLVNNQFKARLIIGAGGHFCPVARHLGAKSGGEAIVAAQEAEFEMDVRQQKECSIRSEVPELFFCPDMKGYGWAFRKGNFLNIGLGRLDRRHLSDHVSGFISFLKNARKIPGDVAASLSGHAYLLYGLGSRRLVTDGILLVGDAAGLAYWQSGEGIRPAVESGLMAAEAVVAARGDYREGRLERYREMIAAHFGKAERDWTSRLADMIPQSWIAVVARKLLATRWFSRHVLLDHWFLHSHQPALRA
jgi:geranylgeranyl reductase family protein